MDQLKDIVELQHTKLNINDIVNLVSSPKCGAISTFIGTTRDNFESKSVSSFQLFRKMLGGMSSVILTLIALSCWISK